MSNALLKSHNIMAVNCLGWEQFGNVQLFNKRLKLLRG